MKIEVYEADDAKALVSGRREVWLRVLSNEVVDLPRVRKQLSAEQQSLLAQCRTYPSTWYPDDEDTEGYPFGEWFVFERVED